MPIEARPDEPVRKSITVNASVDHAFRVFTEGFHTWWPSSHHAGPAPLKKAVIEGHAGGRCYSEQTDGTEWDWGRVLVWEPPHRFVMAWQLGPGWGYNPDLGRASEVEVRFTPEAEGSTRVDLEHRHFYRHGPGGEALRAAVASPGGWAELLRLYADRVAERT